MTLAAEVLTPIIACTAAVAIGQPFVRFLLQWLECSVTQAWGGDIPRPSHIEHDTWRGIWQRPGGGAFIGFFEMLIFFGSLWADGWPVLAAYLAFKLACQWESWKHSDGVVEYVKDKAREDRQQGPGDLLAIQRWVTVRYLTFLVGTGANIAIAMIAVAAGRATLRYLQSGFEV